MKQPPLSLPGAHFAAATCFLIAGAFGLVYAAPMLAAGSYPANIVLGTTHLFTLGWLTTSIMGALYQFLPVALGQSITSEKVAYGTGAVYVTGVTLLVSGMYSGFHPLLLAGITTIGLGLLLFLTNLGIALHRSTQRDVTWWAVTLAATFLGLAFLFGMALGINRHSGFLGAARPIALGTHLHVALFGWIVLVIVGVSHRLLPMFLLSHGGRTHFGRIAVALLAAGAVILALFHHLPVLGRELPALLFGGGIVAYLIQAREFYRRRHRPQLDPGLHLAAIALVVLAVVLPLGAVQLVGVTSLHLRVAYVLVALTGCTLFVAAHYYKIVPFLVWNARFGPLAGTRPLPKVGELYHQRTATVAISALAAGGIALATAVGFGSTNGVRVAALLFTLGVLIEAAQMSAIARRRP